MPKPRQKKAMVKRPMRKKPAKPRKKKQRQQGKGVVSDFVKKHKGKIATGSALLGTAALAGYMNNRRNQQLVANIERMGNIIGDDVIKTSNAYSQVLDNLYHDSMPTVYNGDVYW